MGIRDWLRGKRKTPWYERPAPPTEGTALRMEQRRELRDNARFGPDCDPVDPHGDGTLRPGDPVFEAAMRGKGMIGRRGPDGWVLEEFDVN